MKREEEKETSAVCKPKFRTPTRRSSLTDCSAAFDAFLDERHGTFPAASRKDVVASQRVDEDENQMVEGRALPIPKMLFIRRRAFSRGDLNPRV